MSKDDQKDNKWERNTSKGKMRNVKAMPTRKIDSVESGRSNLKKGFFNTLKSNSHLKNFVLIATPLSLIIGFFGTGLGVGIHIAEQQQPVTIEKLKSEIEKLESEAANEINPNSALMSEKTSLEADLAQSKEDLKELQEGYDSLLLLQNKNTSGEIELVTGPAEIKIRRQDTAVFFDSLNVSIVNINSDNSTYLIDITVSANNKVKETFKDLKVGDKSIYKYTDFTYEVLITSTSLSDVGVTVFRYQKEE